MKDFLVASLVFLVLTATFGVHSAFAQEEISLEATSDQGTFDVAMTWQPNEIGRDNIFAISFVEPETGAILEDIQYNIRVLHEEAGEQTSRRVDQISTEQRIRFDEPGSFTIMIEDIEGLGENASFPIQVTPEFPPTIFLTIILLAGGMSIIVITRLTGTNLFRFKT